MLLLGPRFRGDERTEDLRIAALRPLLALLLHVGAQHRVHAPLIAGAFLLEIIEHVLVEPDRDRLLLRRNDEYGFGPVKIKRNGVRIISDSGFDFFISKRIDRNPVSLPPSGIV